jgi:hypothetical protein
MKLRRTHDEAPPAAFQAASGQHLAPTNVKVIVADPATLEDIKPRKNYPCTRTTFSRHDSIVNAAMVNVGESYFIHAEKSEIFRGLTYKNGFLKVR